VRVEIAQTVSAAARVLQGPSPAHLPNVNNIFKYVAGSAERGIIYRGTTKGTRAR